MTPSFLCSALLIACTAAPDPAGMGAQVVVWRQNAWLDAPADARPKEPVDARSVKLTAALDEYVSLPLMVTNLSGRTYEARVTVNPLRGPITLTKRPGRFQGLSGDWCEVRHAVQHLNISGRLVSDPLPICDQANRIVVPDGETRQLWLTIRTHNRVPGEYTFPIVIDPTVEPGDYDEAGDVTPHRLPTKTVNVAMRLMPVRLFAKMPIAVWHWSGGNDEAHYRDMIEHKVNYLAVATGRVRGKFEADGTMKSIDFSSHDTALQPKLAYVRSGQVKIMFIYGVVASFDNAIAKRMEWSFMSAPWEKSFRSYFTAWIDHLKDLGMGYDDFAMQIWDEARGDELVGKVVKVGPLLRELDPNVVWMMDGTNPLDEWKRMDPYVDIWVPTQSVATRPARWVHKGFNLPSGPELMAWLRSTGKPIWMYSCAVNTHALSPSGYYRAKPWRAWAMDLQGIAFWGLDSWKGPSAWHDFDGRSKHGFGDCNTVFPGAGEQTVTTRRWEAWREGLQDYLYLLLVRKNAQRAGDTNAIKAIDEMVASVLASRDSSSDPNVYAVARQALRGRLERLAEVDPPKITSVNVSDDGVVTWTTDRPTTGQLLLRRPWDRDWRTISTPIAKRHEVKLTDVPPLGRCELFVTATDDCGVVAAHDQKLHWTAPPVKRKQR